MPEERPNRVKLGVNDLATVRPDLVAEWDFGLNSLEPYDVNVNSHKSYNWVCVLAGHSWAASVKNRNRGNTGCPVCARNTTAQGINDLATVYPGVLEEWDFSKNNIDPKTVSASSSLDSWWVCELGHSWSMRIANKVKRNSPCPYCSFKKVLSGFNDFATTEPLLMLDWSKENIVDATLLTRKSSNIAFWTCSKSHQWKASLRNRAVNGSGCPVCAANESKLESKIAEILDSKGVLYERRIRIPGPNKDRRLGSFEIDFHIPSYSIGIEVQDFTTHSAYSDTEIMIFRARKSPIPKYKKGPLYHEAKRSRAKSQLGIKVVDIWQDEIANNYVWDILEEILKGGNKNAI